MRKNMNKRNKVLTNYVHNILGNQEILKSLMPQKRAKFYFDQRKKSNDSIEYLTFMVKHLPEKQLEQIFNIEKMRPFFQALFDLEIKAESHEEYLRIKESEEIKPKLQRLLALSAGALSIIGRGDFVQALLPDALRPYLNFGFPPTKNFEAILSYSLH